METESLWDSQQRTAKFQITVPRFEMERDGFAVLNFKPKSGNAGLAFVQ
jgi:hypothetical protein